MSKIPSRSLPSLAPVARHLTVYRATSGLALGLVVRQLGRKPCVWICFDPSNIKFRKFHFALGVGMPKQIQIQGLQPTCRTTSPGESPPVALYLRQVDASIAVNLAHVHELCGVAAPVPPRLLGAPAQQSKAGESGGFGGGSPPEFMYTRKTSDP